MKVKLKVVHGMLQNRQGDDAGVGIDIRRDSFVIGSAEDAHMRCLSKAISPHHCELTLSEEEVLVRDLASQTGTFVNGQQLTESAQLRHGDRIKVGRLEFEIEISSASDPVSKYVSDLLEEGDEEARLQRLHDPQQRQYHMTPPSTPPAAETPPEPEKKKQRPPKKPPGKLPPPKPIVADNTVDAAAASLKRIFEKE